MMAQIVMTNYGFVAQTLTEQRQSDAKWKKNGMPANLNAALLLDFLTLYCHDCFIAATDPNEGIKV